ncbi:hypothetical protein, partial [Promicromonospora kroppenstedtii]|uniref:hypothetical protein n=1 Tax=Promicromonospora kroppenstedtii TaxID=440482 RepID=UPI00056A20FA
MLPRPTVEKMLDHALRPGRSGMVVLRGPRGAGRGTAVRLWSRRLADDGRVVVRVDVGSGDAVDGATLGTAIRARLAQPSGPVPTVSPAGQAGSTPTASHVLDAPDTLDARSIAGTIDTRSVGSIADVPDDPNVGNLAGAIGGPSAEDLAEALDAREIVLVVDRLGPASVDALVFLDRMARRLRRGRVVVLTAMPLPGPEPTFDAWAAPDPAAPAGSRTSAGPA